MTMPQQREQFQGILYTWSRTWLLVNQILLAIAAGGLTLILLVDVVQRDLQATRDEGWIATRVAILVLACLTVSATSISYGLIRRRQWAYVGSLIEGVLLWLAFCYSLFIQPWGIERIITHILPLLGQADMLLALYRSLRRAKSQTPSGGRHAPSDE